MVETVESPETMHEVDFGSFEEVAKRLRTRNEHLFDGWKTAGASMIALYTGVTNSLLDLREIVLETQLEWLSAVASAQALSIRQAQATQTRLAREMLATVPPARDVTAVGRGISDPAPGGFTSGYSERRNVTRTPAAAAPAPARSASCASTVTWSARA